MTVRIKLETLLEILYFLDWLLRQMSLGGIGEYSRLSRLMWKIHKEGVFEQMPGKDITKFPAISGVIKNYKRMEKLENGVQADKS